MMTWELWVVLLVTSFMAGGVTGHLLKQCPECPLQPDCPPTLFQRPCLEYDLDAGRWYPIPCTLKEL